MAQSPARPISQALVRATKIAPAIVALRRNLHRHAELAFKEEQTAKILIAELEALGLSFDYQGVGQPVVARLDINKDAPTVALRADMDALPGEEKTGLPFASSHAGNVHACGHDAHMAIVMGAARLLVMNPPKVNVRFVFQPAEERGGGARTVLAGGYLKDVDMIFGGHVTHHYKPGEIMVAQGVITAQSDRFSIHVHGRAGHGARPHEAVDAVVIAGLLITTLQTLVSRETNPLHPSVLTIGRVEAGSAPNVIADLALLEGTIRTTNVEVRDHIHNGIRRMAGAYGELHNAKLDVDIQPGYPPVVNTPRETEIAARAARSVVGDAGLAAMDYPSMGGEDFSFYLDKLPGCYVRFGARPPDIDYIPLHSPVFDIDESVLPIGAAFFYEVVEEAARTLPAVP
jgi:hippurate hydrolase